MLGEATETTGRAGDGRRALPRPEGETPARADATAAARRAPAGAA